MIADNRKIADRATYALAGTIAVCVISAAFFTERIYGAEEIGMHNPPYMYAEFGRMSFPIYGWWYHSSYEKFYIHMPTHYFEIGLLMRAGIGLYYAEAAPTVAFILLNLVLICSLRIESPVKLGMLMGFAAAVGTIATVWWSDFLWHLRPDAHMAMAWFAGLLALENARARSWDSGALFFGSLLMTYASCIHFSGLVAFAGVFVYLAAAARDLPFRTWVRKAVVAAAGGCAVGIPFVLIYWIPNWYEIRYVTDASQASLSWAETVSHHIALYRPLAATNLDAIYAAPLKWSLDWLVPPFLLGAALLAVPRQTRVMAVAALPVPLFLFFVARRKTETYLYPEIIMVLVGFWILISLGAATLTGRLRLPGLQRLLTPALAAAFLVIFVARTPMLRKIELTPIHRVHELTIARAAAISLLGPGAVVASQHALWYVSGGAYWFDTTKDLLWSRPESDSDLATFFSRFDAVGSFAESWEPTNTGLTEASLYEKGVLGLRGLYLAASDINRGWAWLSHDHGKPVKAFFSQNNRLWQFEQGAGDSHVLVTATIRPVVGSTPEHAQRIARQLGAELQTFLTLPPDDHGVQGFVFLGLVRADTYAAHRAEVFEGTHPLEEIHGAVQPVDVPALLAANSQDKPITFVRTYEELIARYATPVADGEGTGAPDIRFSRYPSNANDLKVSASGLKMTASATKARFDWLMVSNTVDVRPRSYYLVSYGLGIDQGGAAVYAMAEGEAKPLASFFWEVRQDSTPEQFVLFTGAKSRIYLAVTAYNAYHPAPVEISIQQPRLTRVEMTR